MTPQPSSSTPRRNFIKTIGGLTAGFAALPSFAQAQTAAPSRRSGGKYMGDFVSPKLDKVKVAIIGVGARGSGHASQLASIEGVDFVGICDLDEGRAKRSADGITKKGHAPKVYSGDEKV